MHRYKYATLGAMDRVAHLFMLNRDKSSSNKARLTMTRTYKV